MDENDLRATLQTLADRAPTTAAVEADVNARVRNLQRQSRTRWPLIAAAAVAVLLIGGILGVRAVGVHTSATAPAAPGTSASTAPNSDAPQPTPTVVQLRPTTVEATTCLDHFPTAVLASNTTVEAVTEVGRRPPQGWTPHMGSHGMQDKITFCLVPHAGGLYDAIAVTADGKTYPQWTQSNGDMFTYPG